MAAEVSLLGRAWAGREQRWGQGAVGCHPGPESCALLCESRARARVRVHARADARLLGACLPRARVVSQAPLFLLFAFVFTGLSKK